MSVTLSVHPASYSEQLDDMFLVFYVGVSKLFLFVFFKCGFGSFVTPCNSWNEWESCSDLFIFTFPQFFRIFVVQLHSLQVD